MEAAAKGTAVTELPTKCGKCPMMGGVMCLDKRVPVSQALAAKRDSPPPDWCPLRGERRTVVQADLGRGGRVKHPPGTITWEEHLEVYAIYAQRYGHSQTPERIAERGGFGYEEAEMLLGRPLRTWEKR